LESDEMSGEMVALRERPPSRGHYQAEDPQVRVLSVCDTERKLVSVLFADVKGSMGLSGSVELEEWWSLMTGVFELMCQSAYRFDGWVANFTGDGIAAVFEGPSGAEDHASRACSAALWLRDAVGETAAELNSKRGLELSIRIGIHTGEVLTGMIDCRRSRYYTASGYAVALAQRMEALALPGHINLSESTAALLGHGLELRDLGPFEIKGAGAPVGVFELVGNGRRR
jgi:class 3 adenylate cyclase